MALALRYPRGASAFFTYAYWDWETTKTTFKNNFALRTLLERSLFQNRYSLRIGKWARAS